MALIDAALNYASSKDTNETNKEITEETNRFNLELAQLQNQWNLEQWQRETAYNDPSSQAQRLSGTGLSKSAIAQSIGNIQSPHLESANLANQQIGNTMVPPVVSGFDLIETARQLMALQKDEQEVNKLKTDNKIAFFEALFKPQQLMTEQDLRNWELKFREQEYAFNAASNPYKFESYKYKSAYDKRLAYGQKLANEVQKQNLRLGEQKFGWLEKLNQAELAKMFEEIRSLKAQTAKTSVEAQNIEQQTEGLKQSNIKLRYEAILSKFGSPQAVSSRIGALIASGQLKIDEVGDFLECTRNYLKSGGRRFSGDSDMRNYYNNIINEGQAEQNKIGIHQFGIPSFFNDMLNQTFKKHF